MNQAWSALLSVLSVLVGGILFRSIVYQSIGAFESGILAQVLSLISILGVFITFGIPVSIVFFLSKYQVCAIRSKYVIAGMMALVSNGIILLACLYIFSDEMHLNKVVSDQSMPVIFSILALSSILVYFEKIFNGLMLIEYAAIQNITNNILKLLFSLLAIHFIASTASAVFIAILGSLSVVTLLSAKNIYKIFKDCVVLTVRLRELVSLYAFGFYQFITMVVDQIIYNSGVLIVGYYLTNEEVAVYSVALLLSQVIWVIPSAIQMLTYPVISKLWNSNEKEKAAVYIVFTIKVSFMVIMPISLGIYFISDVIIQLLFGEDFAEASSALSVLLVGTTINAIFSRPIGAIMAAVGMPKIDVYKALIIALPFIVFSFALIPRFHITGAATAMALTQVFSTVVFLFLLKKYADFSVYYSPKILVLFPAVVIYTIYIEGLPDYIRVILSILFCLALVVAQYFFILKLNERKLLLRFIKV